MENNKDREKNQMMDTEETTGRQKPLEAETEKAAEAESVVDSP